MPFGLFLSGSWFHTDLTAPTTSHSSHVGSHSINYSLTAFIINFILSLLINSKPVINNSAKQQTTTINFISCSFLYGRKLEWVPIKQTVNSMTEWVMKSVNEAAGNARKNERLIKTFKPSILFISFINKLN